METIHQFIKYGLENKNVLGDNYIPLIIFPDLEQAQIICGGVKQVLLDQNPPPVYGQRQK